MRLLKVENLFRDSRLISCLKRRRTEAAFSELIDSTYISLSPSAQSSRIVSEGEAHSPDQVFKGEVSVRITTAGINGGRVTKQNSH